MNTLLLEIAVVAIGIVLLLVEAFSNRSDKNYLSYLGAAGLAGVLLFSFLPLPAPVPGSAEASFVTSDILSVFFVRFILIATIVTLLMIPGFRPVLERYIPSERTGGGLGEFAILPLFA